MTWRESLRDASYRGVPFLYDSTGGAYGRRHARHEYPGRDLPFMEDMGRKPREHTIEAFLLEPGHLAAAAPLIEACEAEGPGTLVHPYWGSLQVVCTGCRQRFTTREGGMASFTLTFVEAGENRYPTSRVDTGVLVAASAAAMARAVQTDFEDAFSVDGHPGFVAAAAAAVAAEAVAAVEAALAGQVPAGEDRAAFEVAVAAIDVETAVQDAGQLAADMAALMAAPREAGIVPTMEAFAAVMDFGGSLAAVPQTTATRQVQAANQAALVSLARRTALTEAARAAAETTFETYEDAIAARDDLADRLDAEMATAGDDVFAGLQDLRAAVVRDVTARAPSLPRLVTHVPAATRPALCVAHDLYGDEPEELIERAAEIAARNRIRHPAFIVPAALEVLTVVR